MASTTRNEPGRERSDRSDLAAAAMDRGREQLENAKGQLADGAERVAAAVERTADELEGDGDGAISGFGRSVASLTRQLAGGLRERDIEEFARELGSLARRNPGVFLAGSVALGFGIARFFKAHTPSPGSQSASFNGAAPRDAWSDSGQQYAATDREYDAEDGLDLSAGSEWQDGSASAQNELRDDDLRSEWASPGAQQSSGTQQAGAPRTPGLEGTREEMDTASTDQSSPTNEAEITSGGKQ